MPAFTLLNKHELRGRPVTAVHQDCPSSDENATITGGRAWASGGQRAVFRTQCKTQQKQATGGISLEYNLSSVNLLGDGAA